MKRSDMIDEIACNLVAFSTTYSHYPLEKLAEVAEIILKIQEDKGMEPPKIVNPELKITYKNVFMFHSLTIYPNSVDYRQDYYVNKWEPEDET